ncbi:conserved hypothetical protein [Ricinus communis]|uniref:Uncharacterized protein n=1 Tax=Ricinus communis TaxID=3988 RepID=B9S4H7_RICCO|nr:conserved hypothetical protein [Ricinus communis]
MQFPSLSMFHSTHCFLLKHTDTILTPNEISQSLIVTGANLHPLLSNSSANYGTSNSSNTGEVYIQITEMSETNQLRIESNEPYGETLDSNGDTSGGGTADWGLALVSSTWGCCLG